VISACSGRCVRECACVQDAATTERECKGTGAPGRVQGRRFLPAVCVQAQERGSANCYPTSCDIRPTDRTVLRGDRKHQSLVPPHTSAHSVTLACKYLVGQETLDGLHEAARAKLQHPTTAALSDVEPSCFINFFDHLAEMLREFSGWSKADCKASIIFSTVRLSSDAWPKMRTRCKGSWLHSRNWAKACFLAELHAAARRGALVVMRAPRFDGADWRDPVTRMREAYQEMHGCGDDEGIDEGEVALEDMGTEPREMFTWEASVSPNEQLRLRSWCLSGVKMSRSANKATPSCDLIGNPAPVTRVVLKDVSGGHLEEWQGSERLGMAVVSLTQDTLMALEGNTLAQWLAAEASGRLACVRCHAMQVALAVHIACERWHVRCCMHIQPRRHATMTCRVIVMLQGLPRRSRMREGPT